jgi:hypothetical protein
MNPKDYDPSGFSLDFLGSTWVAPDFTSLKSSIEALVVTCPVAYHCESRRPR